MSFSFKSREEGDEEGENIITQKSPYSSCLYIYSCILNRIELSWVAQQQQLLLLLKFKCLFISRLKIEEEKDHPNNIKKLKSN